ncbi:MAG: DNA alkylation repair protein, partial [Anaerolineae bacterium]|nr:DNA alkylation repair protein [Anaerolineae bacterium]NIN97595.1 DNA alkylation repair protein [Anaerolineae bacterium]
MILNEALQRLRSQSDPKAVEGMARFGIKTENALGIPIPHVRKIAKEIGKDHSLARELWRSGIHEARILACLVEDPDQVTEDQMESWVKDFDSWDVCDQCCMNLFDRTSFAYQKALKWSGRKEEFVKRAGFALMASLAVHDKRAKDGEFEQFLPVIRRESVDERNFVRKAVNWALRQVGKRNAALNAKAIVTAEAIHKVDSPSARWIATDAL